jgi:hypothetical protein
LYLNWKTEAVSLMLCCGVTYLHFPQGVSVALRDGFAFHVALNLILPRESSGA